MSTTVPDIDVPEMSGVSDVSVSEGMDAPPPYAFVDPLAASAVSSRNASTAPAAAHHDLAGGGNGLGQAGGTPRPESREPVAADAGSEAVRAGSARDAVPVDAAGDVSQAGSALDAPAAGQPRDVVAADTGHEVTRAGSARDAVLADAGRDVSQAGSALDAPAAAQPRDAADTGHEASQAGSALDSSSAPAEGVFQAEAHPQLPEFHDQVAPTPEVAGADHAARPGEVLASLDLAGGSAAALGTGTAALDAGQLRHVVDPGGPVGSLGAVEAYADRAGHDGGQVVLWTPHTRAEVESGLGRGAELAEWAQGRGVVLVSVGEAFGLESPMVSQERYQAYLADGTARGQVEAGRILRHEVAARFPGEVVDLARRAAAADPRPVARVRTEADLGEQPHARRHEDVALMRETPAEGAAAAEVSDVDSRGGRRADVAPALTQTSDVAVHHAGPEDERTTGSVEGERWWDGDDEDGGLASTPLEDWLGTRVGTVFHKSTDTKAVAEARRATVLPPDHVEFLAGDHAGTMRRTTAPWAGRTPFFVFADGNASGTGFSGGQDAGTVARTVHEQGLPPGTGAIVLVVCRSGARDTGAAHDFAETLTQLHGASLPVIAPTTRVQISVTADAVVGEEGGAWRSFPAHPERSERLYDRHSGKQTGVLVHDDHTDDEVVLNARDFGTDRPQVLLTALGEVQLPPDTYHVQVHTSNPITGMRLAELLRNELRFVRENGFAAIVLWHNGDAIGLADSFARLLRVAHHLPLPVHAPTGVVETRAVTQGDRRVVVAPRGVELREFGGARNAETELMRWLGATAAGSQGMMPLAGQARELLEGIGRFDEQIDDLFADERAGEVFGRAVAPGGFVEHLRGPDGDVELIVEVTGVGHGGAQGAGSPRVVDFRLATRRPDVGYSAAVTTVLTLSWPDVFRLHRKGFPVVFQLGAEDDVSVTGMDSVYLAAAEVLGDEGSESTVDEWFRWSRTEAGQAAALVQGRREPFRHNGFTVTVGIDLTDRPHVENIRSAPPVAVTHHVGADGESRPAMVVSADERTTYQPATARIDVALDGVVLETLHEPVEIVVRRPVSPAHEHVSPIAESDLVAEARWIHDNRVGVIGAGPALAASFTGSVASLFAAAQADVGPTVPARLGAVLAGRADLLAGGLVELDVAEAGGPPGRITVSAVPMLQPDVAPEPVPGRWVTYGAPAQSTGLLRANSHHPAYRWRFDLVGHAHLLLPGRPDQLLGLQIEHAISIVAPRRNDLVDSRLPGLDVAANLRLPARPAPPAPGEEPEPLLGHDGRVVGFSFGQPSAERVHAARNLPREDGALLVVSDGSATGFARLGPDGVHVESGQVFAHSVRRAVERLGPALRPTAYVLAVPESLMGEPAPAVDFQATLARFYGDSAPVAVPSRITSDPGSPPDWHRYAESDDAFWGFLPLFDRLGGLAGAVLHRPGGAEERRAARDVVLSPPDAVARLGAAEGRPFLVFVGGTTTLDGGTLARDLVRQLDPFTRGGFGAVVLWRAAAGQETGPTGLADQFHESLALSTGGPLPVYAPRTAVMDGIGDDEEAWRRFDRSVDEDLRQRLLSALGADGVVWHFSPVHDDSGRRRALVFYADSDPRTATARRIASRYFYGESGEPGGSRSNVLLVFADVDDRGRFLVRSSAGDEVPQPGGAFAHIVRDTDGDADHDSIVLVSAHAGAPHNTAAADFAHVLHTAYLMDVHVVAPSGAITLGGTTLTTERWVAFDAAPVGAVEDQRLHVAPWYDSTGREVGVSLIGYGEPTFRLATRPEARLPGFTLRSTVQNFLDHRIRPMLDTRAPFPSDGYVVSIHGNRRGFGAHNVQRASVGVLTGTSLAEFLVGRGLRGYQPVVLVSCQAAEPGEEGFPAVTEFQRALDELGHGRAVYAPTAVVSVMSYGSGIGFDGEGAFRRFHSGDATRAVLAREGITVVTGPVDAGELRSAVGGLVRDFGEHHELEAWRAFDDDQVAVLVPRALRTGGVLVELSGAEPLALVVEIVGVDQLWGSEPNGTLPIQLPLSPPGGGGTAVTLTATDLPVTLLPQPVHLRVTVVSPRGALPARVRETDVVAAISLSSAATTPVTHVVDTRSPRVAGIEVAGLAVRFGMLADALGFTGGAEAAELRRWLAGAEQGPFAVGLLELRPLVFALDGREVEVRLESRSAEARTLLSTASMGADRTTWVEVPGHGRAEAVWSGPVEVSRYYEERRVIVRYRPAAAAAEVTDTWPVDVVVWDVAPPPAQLRDGYLRAELIALRDEAASVRDTGLGVVGDLSFALAALGEALEQRWPTVDVVLAVRVGLGEQLPKLVAGEEVRLGGLRLTGRLMPSDIARGAGPSEETITFRTVTGAEEGFPAHRWTFDLNTIVAADDGTTHEIVIQRAVELVAPDYEQLASLPARFAAAERNSGADALTLLWDQDLLPTGDGADPAGAYPDAVVVPDDHGAQPDAMLLFRQSRAPDGSSGASGDVVVRDDLPFMWWDGDDDGVLTEVQNAAMRRAAESGAREHEMNRVKAFDRVRHLNTRYGTTYPVDDLAAMGHILDAAHHHLQTMPLRHNVDFGNAPQGSAPGHREAVAEFLTRNTRFPNFWETGRSGGTPYRAGRGWVEEQFGYGPVLNRIAGDPRDRRDRTAAFAPTAAHETPAYAGLCSGLQHGGVYGYGSAVLHLREGVRDRATFTARDSASEEAGTQTFTDRHHLFGLLAHGYDENVRLALADVTGFRHDVSLRNEVERERHAPVSRYFEAQIHGGLSWADVSRIVVNWGDLYGSASLWTTEAEAVGTVRLLTAFAAACGHAFPVVLGQEIGFAGAANAAEEDRAVRLFGLHHFGTQERRVLAKLDELAKPSPFYHRAGRNDLLTFAAGLGIDVSDGDEALAVLWRRALIGDLG
ncbi:hypothetical protein ACFWN2_44680 [Lentzea sp. NPDC058436]|uniref:hypothetical protein n=1 Tax=Lentzea sp. NPDC058436 TaxID=3346499 RepID=UPI0036691161